VGTVGFTARDRGAELGEKASGVRLQVGIQKVTGRRGCRAVVCLVCSDFLLLRTNHFPPHLPVEPVDNSFYASAVRVILLGCDGEGASLEPATLCRIPHLGEGRPRDVRKEREFPNRNDEGRPGAPFGSVRGESLALLVERRVDLGDLLGLERRPRAAVSIPVPIAVSEAQAEDAEIGRLSVGDLLQGGE
jgi:hypothetical protein